MRRRATSLVVLAGFFMLAAAVLIAQRPPLNPLAAQLQLQQGPIETSGKRSVPPSGDVALFSAKVTGQGQPMILIPGLESSGAVWDGTVSHYAATYQCHALTLAGFAGQPPSSATPFLMSVTDAIATYIRRERLNTPVLVGHSLGGVLALSIAAKYPDLVGKVVTIDGPPAPGLAENPNATPDQLKIMAEQAAASFVKMDPATRQEMLLKVMVTNPEHLQLMRSWGPSDPETVRRALAEIITTDLRPDLARIQTPILVVGTWVSHGPDADSASVARTFKDQFSQAKSWQLEMAPKSRHFVMYDEPDWLFAKMDAFLARTASGKH